MFALKPLAAAALAFALVGTASADVIMVTAIFDPGTLTSRNRNEIAINPVTLGTGDTLDLAIAFGGLPVNLTAGSDVYFGLLTSDVADAVDATSTLSFYSGRNTVASVGPVADRYAYIHLGSYFNYADMVVSPGDFSFVGVNQIIDVLDAPGGPRVYDRAFFYYTTTLTSTVPEPASLALVMASLGLAGVAGRRRNRAAKA